jgi:hypothetical protein
MSTSSEYAYATIAGAGELVGHLLTAHCQTDFDINRGTSIENRAASSRVVVSGFPDSQQFAAAVGPMNLRRLERINRAGVIQLVECQRVPAPEASAAAIVDLGSASQPCSALESRGSLLRLLFHYGPACLNVFVSRVVQTGLPEFGTLSAHFWPKGARVDALEDLINLFGFIDLEWSYPPGSNRRPADYEYFSLVCRPESAFRSRGWKAESS